MAKILKNFKKTGKLLDGQYPYITIREDSDVFMDLPICAIEYDTFYIEPVVVLEPGKIGVVHEAKELLKQLSKLKKFYFLVNDETSEVSEVQEGEANLMVRLPHDTDVSKLAYIGGEIVLLGDPDNLEVK